MGLSIVQRVVLRSLGVKISDDGTRLTIPRKRAWLLDGVVDRVRADAWREGVDMPVERNGDEVVIDGPELRVIVRVV